MAEFRHPPIDTASCNELTLEEEFASRAYELLAQYAVACTSFQGNDEITYPVTDRVDLPATEADTFIALRLVRHPVFAMGQDAPRGYSEGSKLTAEAPSEEYKVIELQYGTHEEEDVDELIDEDFEWHPYVLVVMPTEGEPDILNPANGETLQQSDIMHAGFLMELMAKEIRGMLYEDAIKGDDQVPVYHESTAVRWEDLPTGEQLDMNWHCGACGAVNQVCNHSAVSRNNPILN